MFWSIGARDAATRMALQPIFGHRDVAKSKWPEMDQIPSSGPRNEWKRLHEVESSTRETPGQTHTGTRRHTRETETVSHTIFEGTSEIQQLVIARAISGLRIE